MTEMKNTVLLIFALLCFLAVYATALGDNEVELLERVEQALENTIKAKKTLQQDSNDVGQLVVLQRELQLRDAMENFIERETDDERESLLLELREELENLKATLERLKVNKRFVTALLKNNDSIFR